MRSFGIWVGMLVLVVGRTGAQSAPAPDSASRGDTAAAPEVAMAAPAGPSASTPAPLAVLFTQHDVLDLTVSANFKRLRRDRSQRRTYHQATISYKDSAGAPVTVPVRLRTRGIWRLNHCNFPPLRLNFAKGTKGTLFRGQDKPKLVTHCVDTDAYEQYVVQEYLLYRIYSLLTPLSHGARLARISWADSGGGTPLTRHAIIVEDENAMAKRMGGKILEAKGAVAHDLDPYQQTLLSIFQYFIGNTDWSIAWLHNVELLQAGMVVYPVAYDFDFAGVINAHYAKPDPRLAITSVRQRLYRGYCTPREEVDRVIALFLEKRDAIYALYRDAPGLDRRIAERTLSYYDDFYRTIGEPKRVQSEIVESCLKT